MASTFKPFERNFMLDWSTLIAIIAILWEFNFTAFLGFATGGLVLGGLCWWAGLHFSTLWNTRYRMRLHHHLLCGAAAICTMLSVVALAGLFLAQQAAHDSLAAWEFEATAQLGSTVALADDAWRYLTVKAPGLARLASNGEMGSSPIRQGISEIRRQVSIRVDNFMFRGRLVALLVFAVSQIVAFSWIAIESYSDIKVRT